MTHVTTADSFTEKLDRPVRAGVFPTVTAAGEAVERLLAAGFAKKQITVICSDETKERYFRAFEHQDPAGANTPAAAATGGAIGATVGSVAAGAVGVATGGLPLLVAGGIGLMAGAVWGGFLGAMMTRGLEKEAADYYDQAVQKGKLLVAVEHHDEGGPSLAVAERILSEAGAEPLPLTEG
jgi:hypothetical protein